MKKALLENYDTVLNMFTKHSLSDLSTVIGGDGDDTHTAPENTTSSASDTDVNTTDADGGGGTTKPNDY